MTLFAALVVVAGLVGLSGCNRAVPARNANRYAGNHALFGHFDLAAAELRSNLAALEAENADPKLLSRLRAWSLDGLHMTECSNIFGVLSNRGWSADEFP